MVVAPKAGEALVKPIDVWANQTQKSASLLGLDSPLFGATTIRVSEGNCRRGAQASDCGVAKVDGRGHVSSHVSNSDKVGSRLLSATAAPVSHADRVVCFVLERHSTSASHVGRRWGDDK